MRPTAASSPAAGWSSSRSRPTPEPWAARSRRSSWSTPRPAKTSSSVVPRAAMRRISRRPPRSSRRSPRWSRPATACRSWSTRRVQRAIADVAEFFKISPASDIKTVAYMGKKQDGDRQDRRDSGHRLPARRPLRQRDQVDGRRRRDRVPHHGRRRTCSATSKALPAISAPSASRSFPQPKAIHAPRSSSSTRASKAARIWSAERTSWTITFGTSCPAATSRWTRSPTSAT